MGKRGRSRASAHKLGQKPDVKHDPLPLPAEREVSFGTARALMLMDQAIRAVPPAVSILSHKSALFGSSIRFSATEDDVGLGTMCVVFERPPKHPRPVLVGEHGALELPPDAMRAWGAVRHMDGSMLPGKPCRQDQIAALREQFGLSTESATVPA